jgi:hypothetical protein
MKFKFLLFLFFSIFVNAQNYAFTINQMRLKGKIKNIVEVKEKCPKVAIVGQKFECPKSTVQYDFDRKGKLLNSNKNSLENSEVTKKKNLKIETVYEVVDGIKKRQFENIYNSNEQLLKATNYYVYGKEEEIIQQSEYTYNKNKQIVEARHSTWWNNIVRSRVEIFNEYGDKILEKIYANEKIEEERKIEYLYEFDSYGNWIKKTDFDNNETWTRKLTYY